MERFPWHPRFRPAGNAWRLVIAAVAALTLVVVAAVGMAATLAPGPNGCPTNKSLKTAPIADLAPPARTQIEAFDVLSGPINEQTQTFTLKVRVGSTCSGIDIKGASVYVTAVPVQPVHHPRRRTHRRRRHRNPRLPPRRQLPRQQPAATADAVHPRHQTGRRPPRRRLHPTARRNPLRELTPTPLRTAAPNTLAARPSAARSHSPGCRVRRARETTAASG